MKFYLIIAAIFLTLFKVSDGGLSVTYGDILIIVLFPIFINDLFKGKVYHNKYIRLNFIYVLLTLLSSLVNVSFLEGPFLNFFRTSLVGLMLFTWVYSLTVEGVITGRKFFQAFAVVGCLFVFKTWPEMQNAWSERNFTNVNIFQSSLNLNTWGFTLIVILLGCLYSWAKNVMPRISLMLSILFVIFIFFSFSRTAYALTLLSVGYTIFFVKKVELAKISVSQLGLTGVLVILLAVLINFLDFKIPENAWQFFTNKSDNAAEDLVNTRFYTINIEPLESFYSSVDPLKMVIGDGLSHQHSFLSHTLIVTGVVGFFLFCSRYLIVFSQAFTGIKMKECLLENKFLILIPGVILINDFITNISFYLPIASYLGNIVFAHVFGSLIINKKLKNEKKTNNPNRV